MKTHLKQSDEPIFQGGIVVAECGAEVQNARFVMMWDSAPTGANFMIVSIGSCRECCAAKFDKRYIFGVVNGQEIRTQQNEL